MNAVICSVVMTLAVAPSALAQTRIQIVPPGGAVIAAGQRFDLRVEATSHGGLDAKPPAKLEVSVNGRDITGRNELDPGETGERGAGGTGKTSGAPLREVVPAAPNTTNFLVQDYAFEQPGTYTIAARTADGATARAVLTVTAWQTPVPGLSRARNIIVLLGDGMGAAHRTAARIVSRGIAGGRPLAPLAMDRMPVTGQVMTASLNSIITDSAPGMASYASSTSASCSGACAAPASTSGS
jgi:alkaline phosphatase